MNAMFVRTASSCGVTASGMSEIAPTVPWIVSSRVRPVKTRIVSVFSSSVSVAQDWMSLLSGTFSGSQKLPVRRSQTSSSIGSTTRFQLMASTCDASVRFSNAFSLPKVLFVVSTSCLRGRRKSYARARPVEWDPHEAGGPIHIGPPIPLIRACRKRSLRLPCPAEQAASAGCSRSS